MYWLTCSLPLLQQYLQTLWQGRTTSVRCPIGVSRWQEHLELLVAAPGSSVSRTLLLARADTSTIPHPVPLDCAGLLLLGTGQQRGRASGFVRLPTTPLAPLHGIRLVGPGMPMLPLHQELASGLSPWLLAPLQSAATRWSRTIGALGQEAWQRLVRLRYGIIGVGRSGSQLAQALARLGVARLTLIDPDQVELHNLGEMAGVTTADLGQPKVEALATALQAATGQTLEVVPVSTSITRLHALHAVQACDFLVSCVAIPSPAMTS